MSTEEVLRDRLRSLAAAGIPPPALEVDGTRTPRDPSSAVSTEDGVHRIVVSEELLDAPPAEQHWYLAAPPWYRRPFASEPPAGHRVVDARAEVGPDPSLF